MANYCTARRQPLLVTYGFKSSKRLCWQIEKTLSHGTFLCHWASCKWCSCYNMEVILIILALFALSSTRVTPLSPFPVYREYYLLFVLSAKHRLFIWSQSVSSIFKEAVAFCFCMCDCCCVRSWTGTRWPNWSSRARRSTYMQIRRRWEHELLDACGKTQDCMF